MSKKVSFLKNLNRILSLLITALVISTAGYLFLSIYGAKKNPVTGDDMEKNDMAADVMSIREDLLQRQFDRAETAEVALEKPLQSTPVTFGESLLGGPKAETDHPMLGKTFPPFQIDGLSINDFDKKPVIVNFFAMWCDVSQHENIIWNEFAKEHDIPVYGVNIVRQPEDDKDVFFASHGNPYNAWGRDDFDLMSSTLKITSTPTTFILDKDRKIRIVHEGEFTHEQLYFEVLPLIEELSKGGSAEISKTSHSANATILTR